MVATFAEMTTELMTAQCFVFFVAGFDTSSVVLSLTLLELAINQNLQKRLQTEIDEYIQKNDHQITYDMIKDMPYLHKVVQGKAILINYKECSNFVFLVQNWLLRGWQILRRNMRTFAKYLNLYITKQLLFLFFYKIFFCRIFSSLNFFIKKIFWGAKSCCTTLNKYE